MTETPMHLEGIHHVTAITGDAPRNVDFYARVLGLRMVKRTVNQDDPGVYHLFYADEDASPGADLTFFEYPGAARGRAGSGMVHTIVHRVGSSEALDFWEERLHEEGHPTSRAGAGLAFADPEGLAHELVVNDTDDRPLIARAEGIPDELALQGFDSVRASVPDPEASTRFAQAALNMARSDDGTEAEARGVARGGSIAFDRSTEQGRPGAGTVHHVAFATLDGEQGDWRTRVEATGARPTPVIDRFWFKSVYFREPGGVLYELATMGPGFATDEPLGALGEKLVLPPNFEHLRERVEQVLTPLPDTQRWRRSGS